MVYRVYSGPQGSEEISPLEKNRLFKEVSTLDDALSWALHLERTGAVPLLIEGEDGVRMNKRDISEAMRAGLRERVGGG